ncbi:CLUMA_CG001053, isoform A [Clunio marinus]|uniref:CLUMA_CG001053, isoform A n=1 Tax=Clunio marinus TaxID=568069 RepID=A0A1J1HH99_9DIPT|nr:CLUMA_CG001053, isoform A [Clunio marinus]
MKSRQIAICVIIIVLLIADSDELKVIFARNSTAHALRQAQKVEIEREKANEDVINTGTIINAPNNCKPGFIYEPTFHKRCRKVSV